MSRSDPLREPILAKGAPLGRLADCRMCGGKNQWTGREKNADQPSGSADGPQERLRLAEYRCAACGRPAWVEISTAGPAK